jgi:hypothetical protein
MEIEIIIRKKVEVKYLQVDARPRYWEDADVNGERDENGDLIPCREGDSWRPLIELETGTIVNWPQGTKARIHYKVCDQGVYRLLDEEKSVVSGTRYGDYVPDILCPFERGHGDYIIMNVNDNGVIEKWKCNEDLISEIAKGEE